MQRTDRGHLCGRDRLIERHADEALRRQIVYAIRLRALDQPHAGARVGQIELDQLQFGMVAHTELFEAPEIDGARATKCAEDAVTGLEQLLRQICAVLAGYPCNDRLRHGLGGKRGSRDFLDGN